MASRAKSVSGLFVGFVLGLQGDYVLSSYGSEQALGVLVALSLLRELGPVVTAKGNFKTLRMLDQIFPF